MQRTTKFLTAVAALAASSMLLDLDLETTTNLSVFPEANAAPAAIESEIDKVLEEPLLDAMTEGDPQKKATLRKRLLDAYDRGGEDALYAEMRKIGEEFGANTVMAKIPRAQDEDLMEYFDTSVSFFRKLEFEDAVLCYQWAFGAQYNDPFDPVTFSKAIGTELDGKMSRAIVAIVRNASDMPIAYNRAAAQQSIQVAAGAVLSQADQGTLQVIGGARPANSVAEKKSACRTMGNFYAHVLGLHNAADAFRELFAPQNGQVSHLGGGGSVAIKQVLNAGDPDNIFAGIDADLINALR